MKKNKNNNNSTNELPNCCEFSIAAYANIAFTQISQNKKIRKISVTLLRWRNDICHIVKVTFLLSSQVAKNKLTE